MPITLTGRNDFYEGWLYGAFVKRTSHAEPAQDVPDLEEKSDDWVDGFEMARGISPVGACEEIQDLLALGDVTAVAE